MILRGDHLGGVGAIGEHALDEWQKRREARSKRCHRRDPAPGRMGLEHQASPVRIDHGMTLAPVELLARIITSRPAGFSGLDALAVDDRRDRAGLAADPFAIQHHQSVVEPFKAPVVAPGANQR